MASNGYDYVSAKVDALKGMPMTEIATKYSIPYATLQQYAYRHKWTTDKTRVRQVLSDTVETGLADLGKQWLSKVSVKAHSILDALNAYDFAGSIQRMKPAEAIAAFETIDRIARRTYGHDKVEASKPASLTINMAVTTSTDAAPLGKVIDVDGVLVTDAPDTAPKQIG